MRLAQRAGPCGLTLLLTAALAAGCSCGESKSTGGAIEVWILAPQDGAEFAQGAPVTFQGRATRAGTDLAADELAWSSSLDGPLGTGSPIARDDLSVGAHTITLAAEGQSAAVEITVAPDQTNEPPVPEILAPAEGAQFEEGEPVVLSGRATDPEDGELPGSALTWTSDVDGLLGNGASLTVPSLTVGSHLITLVALDGAGATGRASVGLEVFPAGQNRPPVVTIVAPADGAAFEVGELIDFSGTAADAEDGLLSGADVSWTSDRDGALGSGLQITATPSQGIHTITFTATDTDGASGSTAITIAVNPAGNEPPTVSILAPADGATFEEGDEIAFSGQATDPEDGDLGSAALVWSSDLDGELGAGKALAVTTLSLGLHRVRLVATDSGGAAGTASIQVRVTERTENQPPTAEIIAPADGASFEFGTAITLQGQGSDPEDGVLSGAGLSWSSDLDGPLGTGASLTIATLTEGAHRITLTAIDSRAATGQHAIGLTITPKQVENLAPTARLTGPAEAMARTTVVLDGSGSTDVDGTVVRYVFDFGDGSPPQDGSAPTAEHEYSAEGEVTVALTVHDDDDATGTAELTIAITPFERTPRVAEDSRDNLGSTCALGFDDSGLAVIAYRNDTHPSVRLAREQEDGSFLGETVEGFGLDIGGDAGEHVDLAVDRDGAVHLAYLLEDAAGDTWLRYARGAAGVWSLVTVDAARGQGPGRSLGLALNPVSGDRPEILYRSADGDAVRLARCDAACGLEQSWSSEALYTETRGQSGYARSYPGGLALAADGSAAVSFSLAYYDLNWDEQAALLFLSRSPSGPWSATEAILPESPAADLDPIPSRVALDAIGEPLVIHGDGVSHRFGVDDWRFSRVEEGGLAYFDLAFDASADTAFLLTRHGSELEVVGENDRSYWIYRALGPVDAAWPEIALGPEGEPRACFARDHNVIVF